MSFCIYFVGPEVSDENSNCYRDSPSERIFDDQHKLDYNTPDECDQLCSDLGFALYGVEYANECFCGNNMPSEDLIIDMSECNMDCAGDASQKCGGHYAINIGQADKPTTSTPEPSTEPPDSTYEFLQIIFMSSTIILVLTKKICSHLPTAIEGFSEYIGLLSLGNLLNYCSL